MKYEITFGSADINKTKQLCEKHNISVLKVLGESMVRTTGEPFHTVKIGHNKKEMFPVMESIVAQTEL